MKICLARVSRLAVCRLSTAQIGRKGRATSSSVKRLSKDADNPSVGFRQAGAATTSEEQ